MTSSQGRYRVLIVDDEAAVTAYVDRVLRAAGYDTTVAHGGESALTAATGSEPYDLLLTDLLMPGMSGDELARALQHQQPDLKVLYLTGYSDQLFKERGYLGANEAFLDKPASGEALRQAVSLALFGRIKELPH